MENSEEYSEGNNNNEETLCEIPHWLLLCNDQFNETNQVASQNKSQSSDTFASRSSDRDIVGAEANAKLCIKRPTPLPILYFADNNHVWENMVAEDELNSTKHNANIFVSMHLYHLRAMLLDWLMELSQFYNLHRTTYYLAVDYFDRYLTLNPTVPNALLQLIGVTSLFVAVKFEETYPLKVKDLSYMCDGACEVDDILDFEICLLTALKWHVKPLTPICWLNLYMQIHYNSENLIQLGLHQYATKSFLFPQYSAHQFVRASHLIDLFSLDPGYYLFSYGTIAASAMFFIFGKDVAIKTSCFKWEQIEECVKYMSIINKIIEESNDWQLKCVLYNDTYSHFGRSITQPDYQYILQTHVINLNYFRKVILYRQGKFQK